MLNVRAKRYRRSSMRLYKNALETYVMTHTEINTSLQLIVAREFKKNYRLFHLARQVSKKDSVSEKIATKRAAKKTNYAGFS